MTDNSPRSSETATTSPSGEQAILAAAEHLFSEQGYDAVSMSAIAIRAATSKPNIYHHFKNKHHLYLAVLQKAAEHSAQLLDRLDEQPGTLESKLAAFASGQLGNILAHECRSQLILREALSSGSKRGQEVAKLVMSESFSRLVDMVKRGQQQGEFRSGIDPALAAFMVVSTNVFFFQSRAVMRHLPEINFTDNPDDFSTAMMDIMFNGVLQSKGPQ